MDPQQPAPAGADDDHGPAPDAGTGMEPAGPGAAPTDVRRGVSPLATAAIALIAGLIGLTIGATVGSGEPAAEPAPLAADARPVLGAPDAPVTIELYSDFGCPFCQRHDRDVEPELIARYVDGGQARILWYDVPFQGPTSMQLAVAARAAERQGRFWEFKEAVFATDGRDASTERLRAFATSAGLDVATFEQDLEDPMLELLVRRDLEVAQGIGVRGTPSFLIEGQPLVGAQPLAAFEELIEAALAAG